MRHTVGLTNRFHAADLSVMFLSVVTPIGDYPSLFSINCLKAFLG